MDIGAVAATILIEAPVAVSKGFAYTTIEAIPTYTTSSPTRAIVYRWPPTMGTTWIVRPARPWRSAKESRLRNIGCHTDTEGGCQASDLGLT